MIRFSKVPACILALSIVGALGAGASAGGSAQSLAHADRGSDGMTIARVQYDGGGDWYVGPSTLPNLLTEIRDRAGLPVDEQPVSLRLTDPRLFQYPFIFLTGHGNISLSAAEIRILRRYLLDGGFLFADDCYGMDESFRREIARVFPDRPLAEIPHDHPVFHSFYSLPEGMPKIHEHDAQPPQAFGIFDDGRLMVLYGYESDIHDGWEDADVHGDPPEVREAAFRMGVNIFLYALSQVTG